MVTLTIFLLSYLLFVFFGSWRAYVALAGTALLILTGEVTWKHALIELINWNVVTLFFGTLILAELFMQSRMPAVLAEWVIDKMPTARSALLAVIFLSSALSMVVENIAVLLLVAPVALSLCEKLNINPIKTILLLAMFTNLQGTATLIGDPPSMILAGFMKLSFMDFFFYQGKPSIFFILQIGAVAAGLFAFYALRHETQQIRLIAIEKVRSYIPALLLIALIFLLVFSSHWDPHFSWLAGTAALTLAGIGLAWHHWGPRWSTVPALLRQLDWDTTLFLAGLFVIVGALIDAGWIDAMAAWLASHLSKQIWIAFLVLIAGGTLISAFVDNVPFVLAMLPVAKRLAVSLGAPEPLFLFALLISTCLGGNITPLGSSTNILAVSMLRKQGHEVSWGQFARLGLPFAFGSVVLSSLFLWYIWS